MAPYTHGDNVYRKSKSARKTKKIAIFLFVILLIVISFITIDWILTRLKEDGKVSNESTASVQSSTINVFRTPYFQFQADKTWREVDLGVKTPREYVYRSFVGTLVQHELVVEVNRSVATVLDNEQNSRVLPVSVKSNRLFTEGKISPHCIDIIKDSDAEHKDLRQQQFLEYEGTNFPCDPNSSLFIVQVGEVGAENYISRKNPDGSITTYKITYRDSTFSPRGRPLDHIINSFQLL